MKKQISYAVYTDVGNRGVNEDSARAVVKDGTYGFVLCDGLGGHGMGDIASQTAVNVFCGLFEQDRDSKTFIDKVLQKMQEELMLEQIRQNACKKMKTTATALFIDGKKAKVGYVGDSRVYLFNKGEVVKHTLDHSVPQMLVFSHEITEAEIRNHPERSCLLRVMGVEWDKPQYEVWKEIPLRKCQAFLMCSDGFWELIEEREMTDLLKQSGSVSEWLEKMACVVKKNGEGKDMDNNTAIAVWCV